MSLRILSVLITLNILISLYLIYLIGSFHRDVQFVKQKTLAISSAVQDVWSVMGGSVTDKGAVVWKHGKNAFEAANDRLITFLNKDFA